MPILSQQQERQKRKKAKDQSGVSGNKKEQQESSSNGSKSKKSKSGNEDAGKTVVVQSSPITSGSVGSKKNMPTTSTPQNAVRSSLTAVDTGTGKERNKSTEAAQQLTTLNNCQVQYSTTIRPVLSSAGDLPNLPGVPKAIHQNGGRGSEETSLVTETSSAVYISALYTNEHRDLKKEIADRLRS